MGKPMTATPPMVIYYRRRLVNVANHLNTLCKIPVENVELPLQCHDLLKDAMKQVIKAYKLLPDE